MVIILVPCFCIAQVASITTNPVSREKEELWTKRHALNLEQVNKGGMELLFIGDSITQYFASSGKAAWEKYYAPRNALNIGYIGDRTENVLRRLENGEIKGLSPKLSVVMVGTNNTGHRRDKPEWIADGVRAICDRLRA